MQEDTCDFFGNVERWEGAKKEEYPKWKDPFTNIKKTKITTENIEEEFRKQQAEQQDWLFNR